MAANSKFSRRRGYRAAAKPITVREDAPESLREALLQIAVSVGLSPSPQRVILCKLLFKLPNQNNWSEYPNVWYEVQDLIRGAEWYQVYDYIEALHERLLETDPAKAEEFTSEINRFFEENGIGWQLVEGNIEIRGPEAFEAAVTAAQAATDEDRPNAASEIHEALLDLSRRPKADTTGAVHHAMAALEAVARDVTGEENATLGAILKENPDLFPKPLDVAVTKIWGYASETARHVREGEKLKVEEAELLVAVAAAGVTYLAKKSKNS